MFSMISRNRSSRLEVLCKEGALKNFTKFTGKHLYQSLFFHEVAGLRPASLSKKSLWHRCFPVNFVKFLRTHFYRKPPMVAFIGVEAVAVVAGIVAVIVLVHYEHYMKSVQMPSFFWSVFSCIWTP